MVKIKKLTTPENNCNGCGEIRRYTPYKLSVEHNGTMISIFLCEACLYELADVIEKVTPIK